MDRVPLHHLMPFMPCVFPSWRCPALIRNGSVPGAAEFKFKLVEFRDLRMSLVFEKRVDCMGLHCTSKTFLLSYRYKHVNVTIRGQKVQRRFGVNSWENINLLFLLFPVFPQPFGVY